MQSRRGFAAEANKMRLYRSIATMDRSAPLPALCDQKPSWAKAASLAREWQLNQLAERLDTLAKAPQA
jgi:DNA polymerase I